MAAYGIERKLERRTSLEYPEITVGYLHLPLDFHAAAEGAARSAICAENQGRFLQIHRRFFETSGWLADTNWVREAEAAGVADLEGFASCLQSDETDERLARDARIAESLGARGTPAMVNKKELHFGVLDREQLKQFANQ